MIDLDFFIARITDFGKLEHNWDNSDSLVITDLSIKNAITLIPKLIENYDIYDIEVYPSADSGILFEIGGYLEVKVLDRLVAYIHFDEGFLIEKTTNYEI